MTGDKVTVVAIEPIFCVADLAGVVDHYQQLGFTIAHYDAGYAFAQRDGLTIHLDQADERGGIYLHVDDADALADAWRAAGVEVTGPEDREWGKHEGEVRDADGNVIRFGSPLDSGD